MIMEFKIFDNFILESALEDLHKTDKVYTFALWTLCSQIKKLILFLVSYLPWQNVETWR